MKKIFKQIVLILVVIVFSNIIPCFAKETLFSDVKKNEWYYDSVKYVFEKGLMNGTSQTKFEPGSSITRGMIVTIIYRMEGSPNVVSTSKFTDVKKDAYYYYPIVWATKNGIVNGYSKEEFAPNDKITREQFATILYRYASHKGLDVSFDSDTFAMIKKYSDNGSINAYAKEAMSWAIYSNLITGTSKTTLEPSGTANRAQAATIFMRFDKWMYESNNNIYEDQDATDNTKDTDDVNTSQNEIIKENETPTTNTDSAEKNENKDDQNNDNKESVTEYKGLYLKAENVESTKGKTVEVQVSLENNPGIMGMIISFEYDEKVMKLVKVLNGDVLTDKNGYVFTSPKNLSTGCRATWYTLENNFSNNSGKFVTLVFEIYDSTPKGTYPVTIKCNPDDVIDMNEKNIELKIFNGQIIIK